MWFLLETKQINNWPQNTFLISQLSIGFFKCIPDLTKAEYFPHLLSHRTKMQQNWRTGLSTMQSSLVCFCLELLESSIFLQIIFLQKSNLWIHTSFLQNLAVQCSALETRNTGWTTSVKFAWLNWYGYFPVRPRSYPLFLGFVNLQCRQPELMKSLQNITTVCSVHRNKVTYQHAKKSAIICCTCTRPWCPLRVLNTENLKFRRLTFTPTNTEHWQSKNAQQSSVKQVCVWRSVWGQAMGTRSTSAPEGRTTQETQRPERPISPEDQTTTAIR